MGIDKKIVPVSEKLRRDPWGFRQQRWSTPIETDIIETVNSDCLTSHLRQRLAYESGRHRSTSQQLDDS